MFNICVFVSGRGSNMSAVLDGINRGYLESKVSLVLSSNEEAYALKIAKNNQIEAMCIKGMSDEELLAILNDRGINFIVLAGYMKILSKSITQEYSNRIINIHPSLIPRHCGRGYYGMKVHESVISSKDKLSGATVHFVDEGVDTGKIIMQESLEVGEMDASTLAAKVLEIEHRIIVESIKKLEEEYESFN